MKLNIWKASYEWSYQYFEQKEDKFKTLKINSLKINSTKHVTTKKNCLVELQEVLEKTVIDDSPLKNGVLVAIKAVEWVDEIEIPKDN